MFKPSVGNNHYTKHLQKQAAAIGRNWYIYHNVAKPSEPEPRLVLKISPRAKHERVDRILRG